MVPLWSTSSLQWVPDLRRFFGNRDPHLNPIRFKLALGPDSVPPKDSEWSGTAQQLGLYKKLNQFKKSFNFDIYRNSNCFGAPWKRWMFGFRIIIKYSASKVICEWPTDQPLIQYIPSYARHCTDPKYFTLNWDPGDSSWICNAKQFLKCSEAFYIRVNNDSALFLGCSCRS